MTVELCTCFHERDQHMRDDRGPLRQGPCNICACLSFSPLEHKVTFVIGETEYALTVSEARALIRRIEMAIHEVEKPFEPLRLEQATIGRRVKYHPSMSDPVGFEGTIASEPWTVGGTPVVRLENMDPAYSVWRGSANRRSHVPAAAVHCCSEVES